MSKHTPGPWKIGTYIASKTVPDSLAVWPADAVTGVRGQASICLVSPLDVTTEADEANARLISAAPDLLAACEAALEKLQTIRADQPDGWDDAVEKMIEAAITKAEVHQ